MTRRFPRLKTPRLVLEPLEDSHRAFVKEHFSHPAVCEFLYDAEPVSSEEEAGEIVAFYRQHPGSRRARWVLTLPEDGTPIGTCGFHCWDETNRCIEVGYDLAPRFQRKGFMKEALEAILQHAFENLGIHRVQAFVALGNERSTRILESLGFAREGIWRDRHFFRGRYYDHYLYSLLERDRRCARWDDFFAKDGEAPLYDGWLDRWLSLLKPEGRILDLGCGRGANARHLVSEGFRVVACDFSREALASTKRLCPVAEVRELDLTTRFPFPDQSFDAVVADLSLHYFDSETTLRIVRETERVLAQGGLLLARVNASAESARDLEGRKWSLVEEGYYDIEGQRKRYFDGASLERFFGAWEKVFREEGTTKKYGTSKSLWEIVLRKA